MERRNISQSEMLAPKKAWGHANGSCNRRKSATPLRKLYEGLLLSLAARKVQKIEGKFKAATQKPSKPKAITVAKKSGEEQKKRFVDFIDIPGTSFITHLSLNELREADKLITLILSTGITKKREERFPPSLPARVWFESEFLLPHGITKPESLLDKIAYFGKSSDGWDGGNPRLVPASFKCMKTGGLKFQFIAPLKEIQKLKEGITTVLNQAKETA